MITKPKLPPRAGYVEVEIDGVRQYQKIPAETDAQIAALEAQNADTDMLVVDHEYRLTLMELGVN